MAESFTWRDGDRTIRFGRGAVAEAASLLGAGYALFSTARGSAAAPAIAEAASQVIDVPPGRVDDVSAVLLEALDDVDLPADRPLVALGGGRVVDVTKSVAAALGGLEVAAVPTTLSAAEMTRSHRLPPGIDPKTPLVRPSLVLNDPELSASQPVPELAGSAANALAHAVEATATTHASPVPTLVARDASRRLAVAFGATEIDRDELALGALLSGYALDASGIGLHHVLAQTLVRASRLPHGTVNAALLPHTIVALDRRGLLVDAATEHELAVELAARADARSLRAQGLLPETIETAVAAAMLRPQLERTPPVPTADEVRAIYRAAW
ncbi:MAG: iron-containing alcohol dehydrogenase [Solirubrobacteraceae bacterium]|nr:iron-containing alcohol dehydrogenase [Solirubrobacteraceae bacterium]